MVKMATQMMSRACQNMLKHISLRMMCCRKPFAQICATIVPSHSRPTKTCRPWVPTRVKKADRKALRCGGAPSPIMCANSYSSMHRKTKPSAPVTSEPDLGPRHVATLRGDHCKSAGEAGEKQGHRLDRDEGAVEQLDRGRTAVGRVHQARIGREQRREEHHVRKDEQPEAVRDDDALRFRAAVGEPAVLRGAVGEADGGRFVVPLIPTGSNSGGSLCGFRAARANS